MRYNEDYEKAQAAEPHPFRTSGMIYTKLNAYVKKHGPETPSTVPAHPHIPAPVSFYIPASVEKHPSFHYIRDP